MKRHIILTVMLFAMLGSLYAQDSAPAEEATKEDAAPSFAPSAGDFSGALLLGRGNFLTTGLTVPSSPIYNSSSSSWTVNSQNPYANNVDANNNDINNIVGLEGRYFITNRIAAKLSGGAIFRNTPAFDNVAGYIPLDPNGVPVSTAAWLPAYNAVVADQQFDVSVNVGGEYHFTTKYSRLFPYVGLTLPFLYARRTEYDPTIKLGDLANPTNPSVPDYIVDVGVRRAEIFGTGFQAVAGFDYYIAEGLYFGIETKPISYLYMYSGKNPAPGQSSLDAKSITWSFLSQTFLKIGVRF